MKVLLTLLVALAVCLVSTRATARCQGGQCNLQLGDSRCPGGDCNLLLRSGGCEGCKLRDGGCQGCSLRDACGEDCGLQSRLGIEALIPFLGPAYFQIRGGDHSSPMPRLNAVQYAPSPCFSPEDCYFPCQTSTVNLIAYTCYDTTCWCKPGHD